MQWANEKLVKSLRQDVPAEAIKLMSHIVSAEHIWLSRLWGQKASLTPWSSLTLSDCEAYTVANGAAYLDIIVNLDEKRFHEVVPFALTNGEVMSSTIGNILCHVPVHSSHHRGQICRILSQHGIEPPALDYIIFGMQIRA